MMTPGSILHRIVDKTLTDYKIKYDEIYENFFEDYLTPQNLKHVSLKKIFLILDRRPHSLISISYAIYISKLTNGELHVITHGLHDQIIVNEAKEAMIKIKVYSNSNSDLQQIIDLAHKVKPDLLIITHTHNLRDHIQNLVRCPILTVKASYFEN